MATVTINVTPVNDAPVITVPETQTINEDETLVFSEASSNQVVIQDVDAGDEPVKVTLHSSIGVTYRTTTFDERSDLLTVAIDLENDGTYPVRGPLVVGVRNISEAGVEVREHDGVASDGMPFVNAAHLAFSKTDKLFEPADVASGVHLTFSNPDHAQFDCELVILGHLNESPTFVSEPRRDVVAGRRYTYRAVATDPEDDPLTFALVSGPTGLVMDSGTGLLSWNTTLSDVGTYRVLIRVDDPFGGFDEQAFAIKVIDAHPNRPPLFTSDPEVEALAHV